MKAFLLYSIINLLSYNSCLKVDIIILTDLSGSVQGYESIIGRSMYAFSNKFDLSEETVKIGIIRFDDNPSILCHLTSDKDQVFESILTMSSAGGNTNMVGAFYAAIEELTNNGRYGYRKLIVIISDGVVDDPPITKQIGEQLKSANILVAGVLVGWSTDNGNEFMEEICSNSYYVRTEYDELPEKIKKLDICF